MKRIILIVVASLLIYGCVKDKAVNVVGNAIVNQQSQMAKAGV
jgi:uncharacterized protein YcfL